MLKINVSVHSRNAVPSLHENLRDESGNREKVDDGEARRAQPPHDAAASWQTSGNLGAAGIGNAQTHRT